ncbi:SDR family oxidoreductase [Pseudochrobactrum sp. sp1633]|uniref:SDR family oxidoreductase n=1 Tax=Pseudochrobactrum sp. sp1633 TaxID=3036706 RepID=UPI0025A5017B|nr:SDR family oxidoreductase [Pseudochrobactrum sp. sp1633]MDM8344119.1 SDR family oxidoreductase [Pseudochrobactrum sp. sp1633]HWD12093.1 SDR family oxidoreductase [Pseudochrobactrum sp.]
MTKTLILGASGQIARHVVGMLAERDDAEMTLFLRNVQKLGRDVPANARIIEGDVHNTTKLQEAMNGQDVVYANLSGDVDTQAKTIIAAMKASGVRKLIFCTTLGIYDEVPGKFGEWNNLEIGEYFPPYRKAADLIEASDLDYAILRPAWLTDIDEVDYETTERNEPFKGTEIARKSVAAVVVDLIGAPGKLGNRNIGINKPGTDGEKPSFM